MGSYIVMGLSNGQLSPHQIYTSSAHKIGPSLNGAITHTIGPPHG